MELLFEGRSYNDIVEAAGCSRRDGGFKGSKQHRLSEVLVMASRVVLKEREDLFWVRVREGMSAAAAACESVGVNRRQGYRWIKAAGGRIPVSAVASSGRYMGQEERLRIADLRLGGAGVRVIAGHVPLSGGVSQHRAGQLF